MRITSAASSTLDDSCGQLQVGVVSQTGNHMAKLWAQGNGDEDYEATGVCVA